jgi:hypothetical protein
MNSLDRSEHGGLEPVRSFAAAFAMPRDQLYTDSYKSGYLPALGL